MINFAILDNLKIKNKLVILFSSILVGFLILGVTYWLEVEATNIAAKRSTAFIQYDSLASQAQKNYLKIRKYETDFAFNISGDSGRTYNEAPLENHKKYTLELEHNMAKLSAAAEQVDLLTQEVTFNVDNADADDYVRNLVTQVADITENYKISFADIVKFQKLVGFTEHDGLRKIANDKFDQLEKSVSRTADSSLAAYLTFIRESQGKIIRSTDLTAAYEDIKSTSRKFKDYLTVSNVIVDERISMNTYIDEYVSNMNSIVSNKRRANQYTELYDFMLGPIFDDMEQSAQNRIDQNIFALKDETDRLRTVFFRLLYLLVFCFL